MSGPLERLKLDNAIHSSHIGVISLVNISSFPTIKLKILKPLVTREQRHSAFLLVTPVRPPLT